MISPRKKKSPAQLQREIDQVLGARGRRAHAVKSTPETIKALQKQAAAGDSQARAVLDDLVEERGLLQFNDPEIEEMFGKLRRAGGHDALVIGILGDPMYTRRFKMPKWNRQVTVLDTPAVAVKHWSDLGIPRSKGAHQQRADYLRDLHKRFEDEHQRLLGEGQQVYGKHGSVIAGGFYENWPDALKDRIRFLAHGSSVLSDAARLHEALSKSRSPVFTH